LPAERSVQFLSRDEVLAIHQRLIEVFGGPEGLRDPGLLDSALHRPQTGYYEDLSAMAAATFESLLMNHPFVDGNNRVAFFATDVFLRLNGWYIEVDAVDAHETLIELLETGRADFDHLLAWIRDHVQRV
jgi:death-on-curing protein